MRSYMICLYRSGNNREVIIWRMRWAGPVAWDIYEILCTLYQKMRCGNTAGQRSNCTVSNVR
jgi:hypothetical protein